MSPVGLCHLLKVDALLFPRLRGDVGGHSAAFILFLCGKTLKSCMGFLLAPTGICSGQIVPHWLIEHGEGVTTVTYRARWTETVITNS